MHLPGRRAFQAEEQPVQMPCGMSMLSILEETSRRLICLGGVSQREGSRRGRREMEAATEVFMIHCKESITEALIVIIVSLSCIITTPFLVSSPIGSIS